MKRSEVIRLGLMGCGLTAVVALSHCDNNNVAAGAYESVDQCVASGKYSRQACEQAITDARKEHQRLAPRFANRGDCEAEFGANACSAQPAESGSATASVFVPAMAGFLLANALGSGFRSQPLYRPCADEGNISNDPRCRRPGSAFSGGGAGSGGRWLYTAGSDRVASAPGEVSVWRGAFSGGSRGAGTLSRGGFGARAAHGGS